MKACKAGSNTQKAAPPLHSMMSQGTQGTERGEDRGFHKTGKTEERERKAFISRPLFLSSNTEHTRARD